MKSIGVLILSLSLFSFKSHAGIIYGKYLSSTGSPLRFVATLPIGSHRKKLEVWVYQDGDGHVLRSFSPLQKIALAQAISEANRVVFVWPELQREALSRDIRTYCELDYNHRKTDLNSLLDTIRARPNIDKKRIVLVGASAGSEVVTAVGKMRDDIAAVVTIGGGVLQLADYLQKTGDSEILKWVDNKCVEGAYQKRSGMFWKQLFYSDLYQNIRAIRVPYLALVGQKDEITRDDIIHSHAERLEKENPNFDYQVIPNMGHGFGWLRPWQWRIIKKWTTKAVPISARE